MDNPVLVGIISWIFPGAGHLAQKKLVLYIKYPGWVHVLFFGKVIVKVLPNPSWLSNPILPRCCRITCAE